MYNRWLVGSWCIMQGAQPVILWQSRQVGWGEQEVQNGEDICVFMVDPSCCMSETNVTLQNNYPLIKIFKKETTKDIL